MNDSAASYFARLKQSLTALQSSDWHPLNADLPVFDPASLDGYQTALASVAVQISNPPANLSRSLASLREFSSQATWDLLPFASRPCQANPFALPREALVPTLEGIAKLCQFDIFTEDQPSGGKLLTVGGKTVVLDFEITADGKGITKARITWGAEAKSDSALDRALQTVHLDDLRALQRSIWETARMDEEMADPETNVDLFMACCEATQKVLQWQPKTSPHDYAMLSRTHQPIYTGHFVRPGISAILHLPPKLLADATDATDLASFETMLLAHASEIQWAHVQLSIEGTGTSSSLVLDPPMSISSQTGKALSDARQDAPVDMYGGIAEAPLATTSNVTLEDLLSSSAPFDYADRYVHTLDDPESTNQSYTFSKARQQPGFTLKRLRLPNLEMLPRSLKILAAQAYLNSLFYSTFSESQRSPPEQEGDNPFKPPKAEPVLDWEALRETHPAYLAIECNWTPRGLSLLFPFGSSPTQLVLIDVSPDAVTLSLDGKRQDEDVQGQLKQVLDQTGSLVLLCVGALPGGLFRSDDGITQTTDIMRALWNSRGLAGLSRAAEPAPAAPSAENEPSPADFDAIPLPFGTPKGAFGTPDVYTDNLSPLSASSSSRLRRASKTSATFAKEDLLLDLLSSQAMLEAKEFEVMEWQQLDAVKKEHQHVVSKLNSLTHKLHLETKMRDAQATLAKSVGSKDGLARSESYHAKSTAANEKIAAVLKQLATTKAEEAELRTKLLRHMAGVLSLVLARREEEENILLHAAVAPPSPPLTSSVKSAAQVNGSNRSSPDLLEQSASNRYQFSGIHFFANNASAVQPLSRSVLASPPPFGLASSFSSPAQKRGIDPSLHAELEQNCKELESSLLQSQQDLREMQKQLEQAQQDQHAELQKRDRNLARADNELRAAQARVAELEAYKTDSEDRLAALHDSQRSATEAKTEIATLRQRTMDTESKLRLAELDRQRGTELRTKQRQMYDSLQAVSDRYRDAHARALGPDVPTLDLSSFDDFHASLPQTLDSFYSQLTQHVSSIKQDLDAAQAKQSDYQGSFESLQTQLLELQQENATVQKQLQQVKSERDQSKQDLDARRQSRAVNKTELAELQRKFHGQSEQLLELARIQQEAEDAVKDVRSLQAERDALEGTVARLQAQIDDMHRKELRSNKLLTDAWRILPSTEARAKLTDADDLRAFKAVYSQTSRLPLGNFALDLANTPKFTPESLADRIRGLVADDKRLVDRLVKHEGSTETQRIQYERQQRVLQETTAALDLHKQQVNELQERIAVSAKQEVAMLEQLNELQAEHERFRLEKRKAEQSISPDRIKELETANSKLRDDLMLAEEHLAASGPAATIAELEQQIQVLRGELEDVQAELDETLNREHKLQAEASKLRMELRTEKRKKANG